ncbi:MAG: FliH/SctL family protein [Vicinamibacterales bacterium]
MSYRARPLQDANVEAYRWDTAGGHHGGNGRQAPAADPAQDPKFQARAAAIERDGFAKGYAQGERAGLEAAATRADGMLRRLGQTMEELAALRGEIIHRTERQMVQLVLAIAERLVHRELTVDRGLLVGMARAALDRLGEHGSATIRLHPDDFAAIGAAALAQDGPVCVVSDSVVTRGGCLVQSDFGFMDVSPESQFRELARTLFAEVEAPAETADMAHGIVLK